jgi:hypothetical protein
MKIKKQEEEYTSDEIEKMLQNIDIQTFWNKVIKKVTISADEYYQARAKSKGVHQVFV